MQNKPLRRIKKEQLNTQNVTGLHPGIWGNFKNLSGDCTNLQGKCTGLSGDISDFVEE